MRSRNLTAAIVATLTALLLATTAVAGKGKTEVGDVEVETAGPPPTATYSGKVKAASRCRKNRRVTLVHDSDPPFTIGETTTDKEGKWEISGPYPSDPNDDRIVVKVAGSKRCKKAAGSFDFYEED